MIALLAALASADPCAREVVLSRGLVVDPASDVSVVAELDLQVVLGRGRVDGIPSSFVRHARATWRWWVSTPHEAVARMAVGGGDALCEGEVVDERVFRLDPGEHALSATTEARRVDACRVRVVLQGTIPAVPTVRLDVHGPDAPGPDAPVDGPVRFEPGGDVVIDVPGCLAGGP